MDLERRIKRLERIIMALAVALVAFVGVGAAYRADVVKARVFEVVDDDGKTKALFGTFESGSTGLTMFDLKTGNQGILISTGKSSNNIAINGRTEESYITLGVMEKVGSAISVKNGIRADISATNTAATFRLRDKKGDMVSGMTIDPNGKIVP